MGLTSIIKKVLSTPFKIGFCCGSKCESSCNQQPKSNTDDLSIKGD